MGQVIGQPDPIGRQPGEALAPKRFSSATLVARRDSGEMSSVAWAAEYQGVPRALEGGRFKREWFTRIQKARPVDVAGRVRYWDKAGTENGGARTCGLLMAKGIDGKFYIEDVVLGQWSAHEREQIIKQTAIFDAQFAGSAWAVDVYVEQEPGSGGKESAEATIANLAGFNVYKDPPSGNKDARLEPFAAQIEAGNVVLIEGTWNREYVEEMVAIPNGQYRDQGDATSGAFNHLNAHKELVMRTGRVKR